MPDHVHLVLKCKPTIAFSDLVRVIKGSSSKWVNEHYDVGGRFSWQEGYGGFSISESQLQKTINYVKNQDQHHRLKSFQDEFRMLLDKHGVKYDERYIWG
jgi:REP element-mobilizing transposase RayT